MLISLDTETTGVDFKHGARPFFVTTCGENGEQRWWEWSVDPLTRKPDVPPGDLDEILEVVRSADELVLQNAKFDVHALNSLDRRFGDEWQWLKTHDTLRAGHLLASNQPHNLTDMGVHYLGIDIEPFEVRMGQIVGECRRIIQQARLRLKRAKPDEEQPDEPLAAWRIAEAGLAEMPSAKEKTWKYDMWLPRALADYFEARGELWDDDAEKAALWRTGLADYANADSATTRALWLRQRAEIERKGLWKIYQSLQPLPGIAYRMEENGVTLSAARLRQAKAEFQARSEEAGAMCVRIAAELGTELKLPKSGNNKSLTEFAFGPLGLPKLKLSAKTGAPSLDKNVLEVYEATLDEGPRLEFVRALAGKRKRDTAVGYMESYERFWVPLGIFDKHRRQLWFRLHPNLNPTGTDTLRWSSNNPNEQNISKQKGFNVRRAFGPAPGREWWSMDASNIELRIPAYESGEKMMVELFDRPDDPPYYGSYHMMIFAILHPEKFAEHGMKCKDVYESTWYQWTKNGNFAVTYGAVETSGTADRAYHVPGAQRRIKEKLRDLTALSDRYVKFADKHGYVETLPDRTVDPTRGYPLLCSRTEWGKVLPTVPFNYHVQGTACEWMDKAMIRCQSKLDEWRAEDGFDGFITMQVHDEMDFDFPKAADPKTDPRRSNLWRARVLRRLMEQGGDDIGVKTPVTVEYHVDTWETGVKI